MSQVLLLLYLLVNDEISETVQTTSSTKTYATKLQPSKKVVLLSHPTTLQPLKKNIYIYIYTPHKLTCPLKSSNHHFFSGASS